MAVAGGFEDGQALLNAKKTAHLMGISASLVYKMAKRREIACVRIRGRVLFAEAQVRQFIEANQVPQKPVDAWF